jgi:hypothetical protein
MKVVTTRGVMYATPVPAAKGKEAPEMTITVNGREHVVPVHDYFHHDANKVIEVDAATARELIKAGAARPHDAVLDDSQEDADLSSTGTSDSDLD